MLTNNHSASGSLRAPDAEIVPADDLFLHAKAIKSDYEIGRNVHACQVVELGHEKLLLLERDDSVTADRSARLNAACEGWVTGLLLTAAVSGLLTLAGMYLVPGAAASIALWRSSAAVTKTSPSSSNVTTGPVPPVWSSMSAATVPPTTGLVAVFFGTRYMTFLYAIVFLSHQVGSFIGVWLGGLLYEIFGNYDAIWIAGAVLGLIAALLHWPIKEQSHIPQLQRLSAR